MSLRSWLAILAAVVLAYAAVRVARQLARRSRGGFGTRFFRHPLAGIGLGVLAFCTIIALAAPVVAPYRPSLQLDIIGLQNQSPSAAHPLGTDSYSRDIWSRVVFGARISMGIGILAASIAAAVGAVIGASAGYFRHRTDTILMRLVDVGMAIPRVFLVLVAIAIGTRLDGFALAMLLGLTGWFATGRLVRADVLALREQVFVDAARALGSTPWQIIGRHVLPNVAATLIVATALGVANMMLLEAGLSFLGVGVRPPTPSWGNMIADAREYLVSAPWSSIFPGLAITLSVMAFHAVADALRDALDPRSQGPV